MTTTNWTFRCATQCVMLIAACSSAFAQRLTVATVNRDPAATVVANVAKMASVGRVAVPDELQYPERYSQARVDSVVTGLEQIARTSSSGFVTATTVSAIMHAGSADHSTPRIFEREIQFYRSTDNLVVRGTILSLMPDQKDRARAIAFLKSVTAQSGSQRDYENAPFHAAEALSHMGHDGRAALRDLRSKGLIKDPTTIGFVYSVLDRR